VRGASHFAVLSGATLVIAILAWLTWRRTREWGFLIGTAFWYYWSLYGGWFVVADRVRHRTDTRYEYLFERMFYVGLDGDYLATLVLYAVFVILIQASALYALGPAPRRSAPARRPLAVSHATLVSVAIATQIAAFLIVRPYLQTAIVQNLSAYYLVAGASATMPYYAVYRLLAQASLVTIGIGIAVYASGPGGRYLVGRGGRRHLVGYLAVLVPGLGLAFALGHKPAILVALVTGGLLYVANASRPRVGWLGGAGAAGLVLLGLIDALRSRPLAAISSRAPGEVLADAARWAVTSGEAFAAHFSMYGALRFDVPLTWGTSLVNLLAAVVPRALWPGRPADIYYYYASQVGAMEGQAYTVHHATGWYLNFGVMGLVAGAVLAGLVWAWLFKQTREVGSTLFRRAASLVSFYAMCAGIPALVRAGPEAYKGLLLDLFVPAVVLTLAAVRLRLVRIESVDPALHRIEGSAHA
jgi:hypothetical protein